MLELSAAQYTVLANRAKVITSCRPGLHLILARLVDVVQFSLGLKPVMVFEHLACQPSEHLGLGLGIQVRLHGAQHSVIIWPQLWNQILQ